MREMRRILLVALMVVVSSSLYGQRKKTYNNLRGLSIEAGVNTSNIASDVSYADGFKVGYNVGLYSGYQINDIMSADIGVQFNSIGGGPLEDKSADNFTGNYISIPLDLNFKLHKGLHASAGAYGSIIVNNDGKDRMVCSEWEDYHYDTFAFNRYDAGLRFKLFYDFDKIRLTAGYSVGLLDAINVDVERLHNMYFTYATRAEGQIDLASRNNVFFLTVGYKLFGKKK